MRAAGAAKNGASRLIDVRHGEINLVAWLDFKDRAVNLIIYRNKLGDILHPSAVAHARNMDQAFNGKPFESDKGAKVRKEF
jgi:hypothetical protein